MTVTSLGDFFAIQFNSIYFQIASGILFRAIVYVYAYLHSDEIIIITISFTPRI